MPSFYLQQIKVHLAGGRGWTGEPRHFLCGHGCPQVSALTADEHAGDLGAGFAVLWPGLAFREERFDSIEQIEAAFSGAIQALLDRCDNLSRSLELEIPGFSGFFEIVPCGACSSNVNGVQSRHAMTLQRRKARGFVSAPVLPPAPQATPKPVDSRQAKADARWAGYDAKAPHAKPVKAPQEKKGRTK